MREIRDMTFCVFLGVKLGRMSPEVTLSVSLNIVINKKMDASSNMRIPMRCVTRR